MAADMCCPGRCIYVWLSVSTQAASPCLTSKSRLLGITCRLVGRVPSPVDAQPTVWSQPVCIPADSAQPVIQPFQAPTTILSRPGGIPTHCACPMCAWCQRRVGLAAAAAASACNIVDCQAGQDHIAGVLNVKRISACHSANCTQCGGREVSANRAPGGMGLCGYRRQMLFIQQCLLFAAVHQAGTWLSSAMADTLQCCQCGRVFSLHHASQSCTNACWLQLNRTACRTKIPTRGSAGL